MVPVLIKYQTNFDTSRGIRVARNKVERGQKHTFCISILIDLFLESDILLGIFCSSPFLAIDVSLSFYLKLASHLVRVRDDWDAWPLVYTLLARPITPGVIILR